MKSLFFSSNITLKKKESIVSISKFLNLKTLFCISIFVFLMDPTGDLTKVATNLRILQFAYFNNILSYCCPLIKGNFSGLYSFFFHLCSMKSARRFCLNLQFDETDFQIKMILKNVFIMGKIKETSGDDFLAFFIRN
jgi:hypothetical protein